MTRSTFTRVARRLPERLAASAAAMAMTAFILVCSDARASQRTFEALSIAVQYSDATLGSNAAAADLYQKLKVAARKVCARSIGRMPLHERDIAQRCYQKSLAEAVRKVDRTLLSALHARAARQLG